MSFSKALLKAQQQILDAVLLSLYGYYLLDLTKPALCLDACLIRNHYSLNKELKAKASALPFLKESIDLIILGQFLHAENILSLVQESYRALIMGGHLIIINYNPLSFCGFSVKGAFNNLSATIIKEYLIDSHFEIIKCEYIYYRSAYIILAIKRNIPLSVVRAPWKKSGLVFDEQVEGGEL